MIILWEYCCINIVNEGGLQGYVGRESGILWCRVVELRWAQWLSVTVSESLPQGGFTACHWPTIVHGALREDGPWVRLQLCRRPWGFHLIVDAVNIFSVCARGRCECDMQGLHSRGGRYNEELYE